MRRRRSLRRLDAELDETRIVPRSGGVYQLCGSGRSGKSMREYAEAWTALALMAGEFVHWIDGATRFNPARVMQCFPEHIPESNTLLRNLFIGRGFTVHQFSSLIERLDDELRITGARLVVVDGPITMHLDPQVKEREARTLLRRCMDRLSRVAIEHNVSVIVITESTPNSKRHSLLLQTVERRCNQRLLGRIERFRGKKKMWLLHFPSGCSGFRKDVVEQETLEQSFSRILHAELVHNRGLQEEVEQTQLDQTVQFR